MEIKIKPLALPYSKKSFNLKHIIICYIFNVFSVKYDIGHENSPISRIFEGGGQKLRNSIPSIFQAADS